MNKFKKQLMIIVMDVVNDLTYPPMWDDEQECLARDSNRLISDEFDAALFYNADNDGEDREEATGLSTISALDYLNQALDIEYRVGSDCVYRSTEILIGCGGPNIIIDTALNRVIGTFGSHKVERPYTDRMNIDDCCREIYEMNLV